MRWQWSYFFLALLTHRYEAVVCTLLTHWLNHSVTHNHVRKDKHEWMCTKKKELQCISSGVQSLLHQAVRRCEWFPVSSWDFKSINLLYFLLCFAPLCLRCHGYHYVDLGILCILSYAAYPCILLFHINIAFLFSGQWYCWVIHFVHLSTQ